MPSAWLKKGAGINRCMNIIMGLDSALDLTNGGEIAANLHDLYDFSQIELYQASVNNDNERISNVERIMSNIREGWEGFGKHA